MALLTGGQRLGLSCAHADNHSNHPNGQKSVLFVKLTDSAFGAITSFVKRQKQAHVSSPSQLSKSTIQLSEHDGTICIPVGDGGDQVAKYRFNVSSTDDATGPQGSFECLEQSKKGNVDAVGLLQNKLTIHASEDTYQRFGERCNQVQKENNKRTTVLLDRGSSRSFGGHKAARKPYQCANATAAKKSIASTISDASSKFVSASKNEDRHHNRQLSHGSSLHANAPDRNPTSKLNSSKQAITEVMKKPLKVRIAHLLAVRPYKKPELLLRIKKDGILEKDKNNISNIVRQVANVRDNTYRLARHMWNDVSEEWPFYSEEERQLFKRSKPQNLTPPGSDGSSSSVVSGLSSSSSRPSSPQTIVSGSSLKKGSLRQRDFDQRGVSNFYESDGTPAPKRKRVSNYVRSAEMHREEAGIGQGSRNPFEDDADPNKLQDHSSAERKTGSWLLSENNLRSSPHSSCQNGTTPSIFCSDSDRAVARAEDKNFGLSSPDSLQLPVSITSSIRMGSSVNIPKENENRIKPSTSKSDGGNKNVAGFDSYIDKGSGGESGGENMECNKDVMHIDDDDVDMDKSNRNFRENLLKTYRRIASKDQRKRYKEEFNKDYAEYRELHGKLHQVSVRFTGLKSQLNQRQEGSNSWKEIEAKIVKEYRRMMDDPEYVKIRQNFQRLHEKLTHVKKLVTEYDDLRYHRIA